MTTTAAQPALSASAASRLAEAMRQSADRRISLVPVFDGKLWAASADVKGSGNNRKRALASVSAIASTPTAAVEALIEKLDGAPQEQSLLKEDVPW